jgi:hypothetical protein
MEEEGAVRLPLISMRRERGQFRQKLQRGGDRDERP